MLEIKEIPVSGYKKVIEAKDSDAGLHCFIAIHNIELGSALGGTRIYPYATREDALADVLRLSEAMTYKSALAKSGTGGGKSVIMGDPAKLKTKKFLHAFGKVIDSLQGDYIAAEDVGTTAQDMLIIHEVTPYVSALPTETSSGDPSRFTAFGVYRGMQSAANKLWGSPSLKGKTILLQGLGNVGAKLASLLFWAEANLIFEDVDIKKLKRESILYGAKYTENINFQDIECDIFSPCALGGVIDAKTVPSLKCRAIVGAANNQLLTPAAANELKNFGILYAPDFVVNAGGLLNAVSEFDPLGYDAKAVRTKVNHIYDTLTAIFHDAEENHKSTLEIAKEKAEYNLENKIGKRLEPIQFKTKKSH
jgi:leucine dehydrogenase